MASEIHFQETYSSGTYKTSPEFPNKTQVVLYEARNSLFLNFGPAGESFEDLTMIPIGVDGAKELLDALYGALVQMGEIAPKKSR